jgi:hypothetical protein
MLQPSRAEISPAIRVTSTNDSPPVTSVSSGAARERNASAMIRSTVPSEATSRSRIDDWSVRTCSARAGSVPVTPTTRSRSSSKPAAYCLAPASASAKPWSGRG